jgi:hypothetical protein
VRGDTMARPDRAAGLYGAINAISDRLDPLIRRFALNRPSQLISRTDSITAVQLSRKSGAVHLLAVKTVLPCRRPSRAGQRAEGHCHCAGISPGVACQLLETPSCSLLGQLLP